MTDPHASDQARLKMRTFPTARTLVDAVTPLSVRRLERMRDLSLVLVGSVLIAACAKIRIGGPIPFTMQSWAVILLGAALGRRRGTLAVIAYLLEGAVGLPVFAGPGAGPAYLMGSTSGFLAGFVPAAYVVGRLAERRWDRRYVTAVVAVGLGDAIILAMGIGWLATFVGMRHAIDVGLRPLWMADLLKVFLAAAALPGAWRLMGRSAGNS